MSDFLQRYEKNPILKPIPEHRWESKMVFNPAAVLKDNKIYLVYRARGEDKVKGVLVSRLGLAIFKNDGVTLERRYEKPIYEPQEWYEVGGCEDPRVTKIKDRYYLLYTAYLGQKSPPLFEEERTNIAMASTKNFFRWKRHGILLPEVLEPEKNGVLFPEKIKGYYVCYYRIIPHIYVAYSKSLENPFWRGHKVVASPRKDWWDSWKIGAGAPPIKTPLGWLFIYHGVDYPSPPRRQVKTAWGTIDWKRKYRLGVMLIDKNNPEKIIYRSEKPILEPKEDYEINGMVPNVVFSCGAVVKDDKLFVYYGGADTVTCVAWCSLSLLLKKIQQKKL